MWFQINSENVVNATHEHTVALIKSSYDTLAMKVVTVGPLAKEAAAAAHISEATHMDGTRTLPGKSRKGEQQLMAAYGSWWKLMGADGSHCAKVGCANVGWASVGCANGANVGWASVGCANSGGGKQGENKDRTFKPYKIDYLFHKMKIENCESFRYYLFSSHCNLKVYFIAYKSNEIIHKDKTVSGIPFYYIICHQSKT